MFRNWGLINKQTKWWLLVLPFLFVITPFLLNAQNYDVPPAVLNDNSFLGSLYGFVVVFFGRLLAFGAGILNFSIQYFVIGAGMVFNEWGVGVAVNAIWGTVRDFFNLTFIFGLVYIGFQMILDSESSSARRNLVYLIGAALLINFSLFITKFVVDISNTAAAVIARSLGDGVGTGFLNLLGLSAAFNVNITAASEGSTALGLAITFTTVVIFCIAAFVFAAGGLLLITRFVVLTFYMIFSPAMFLGWVFPNFQSFSKDYWKGFLKQAFLAPAYLFCLYFTFSVLNNFQYVLPPNANLAVVVHPGTDANAAILAAFYYVFAIIMLIGSLTVARKMSSDGGGVLMKVANNAISRVERTGKNIAMAPVRVVKKSADAGAKGAGRRAGRATLGSVAYAGQRTIGAAANAYQDNDRIKSMTRSESKITRGVGKIMANTLGSLSDSSFDLGNTATGKRWGLQGKKGGYATRIKEAEKETKKWNAYLGQADDNDPLVQQRKKEVDELEEKLVEAEAERDTAKTAEEKKKAAMKVKELKKKTEEAKKKVEQEKNRFAVGSTYNNDRVAAQKAIEKGQAEIADGEKEILKLREKASKLTDTNAIKEVEEQITAINEKRARTEKVIKKAEEDRAVAEDAFNGLSKSDQKLAMQGGYVQNMQTNRVWSRWQTATKSSTDRNKMANVAREQIKNTETEMRTLDNHRKSSIAAAETAKAANNAVEAKRHQDEADALQGEINRLETAIKTDREILNDTQKISDRIGDTMVAAINSVAGGKGVKGRAAESVVKDYVKKSGKSKQDSNFDSLKDAITNSNKSS